jgi:hypothetical protein
VAKRQTRWTGFDDKNISLAWERRAEAEWDIRFVELGRYLCEVRAGQYWHVEKLKSFGEVLARR